MRDRVVMEEGRAGGRRTPTAPLRRISADALRGATTLEQHTLPAVIVGSLATLAVIQLILTW